MFKILKQIVILNTSQNVYFYLLLTFLQTHTVNRIELTDKNNPFIFNRILIIVLPPVKSVSLRKTAKNQTTPLGILQN